MNGLLQNERFAGVFRRLGDVRLNPRRHTAANARAHAEAVAAHAGALARANGCAEGEVGLLEALGLAHDIGKITGTARPERSLEVLRECGVDAPELLSLVKWHDTSLPWYLAHTKGQPPSDKAWRRLSAEVDLRLLALFMVADRVDAPPGWRRNAPTVWFLDEARRRGLVAGLTLDLDDHPGEISAGGAIVREHEGGRLALLIRVRAGGYELPKGGIEFDELPAEAAVREAREEAGVASALAAGGELGRLDYAVGEGEGRRLKRVVYYALTPEAPLALGALPERTRERRWVGADEARGVALVNEGLRPLLLAALEAPAAPNLGRARAQNAAGGRAKAARQAPSSDRRGRRVRPQRARGGVAHEAAGPHLEVGDEGRDEAAHPGRNERAAQVDRVHLLGRRRVVVEHGAQAPGGLFGQGQEVGQPRDARPLEGELAQDRPVVRGGVAVRDRDARAAAREAPGRRQAPGAQDEAGMPGQIAGALRRAAPGQVGGAGEEPVGRGEAQLAGDERRALGGVDLQDDVEAVAQGVDGRVGQLDLALDVGALAQVAPDDPPEGRPAELDGRGDAQAARGARRLRGERLLGLGDRLEGGAHALEVGAALFGQDDLARRPLEELGAEAPLEPAHLHAHGRRGGGERGRRRPKAARLGDLGEGHDGGEVGAIVHWGEHSNQ
jgi:8-oxo-dGTP pyrophosphatase MutT (NUDIX family)